ncbi:RHS repeat domain-containing protein [Streptomyces griseofuscus]|uniref:RHS repeat domain-containing protein n=1 Tax=Streptomyces griseofuscus TaxID=146922 RepID=UPI003F50EA2B
MSWDDQGNLASVSDTATGGTTSYLYDTDGNLVLRTDPGQATLFVDGDQIVENTSTQAISGTRYITWTAPPSPSTPATVTSSTSSRTGRAPTPSPSTT